LENVKNYKFIIDLLYFRCENVPNVDIH